MANSDNSEKVKDDIEDISLGSLLRRSREERNIDLDEAVEATRIRRNNLEALENEDWNKLPSSVFVKGFLKSYAEFLGLDKEMVLDHYRKVFPHQEYKPQALKGINLQSAKGYLFVIIAVLILAFVFAVIYLKKSDVSVIDKTIQNVEIQAPEEEKENLPEDANDQVREIEEEEEFVFEGETENTTEESVIEENAAKEDVTEEITAEENVVAPESEPDQGDRIFRELAVPEEEEHEEPSSPQYTLTANINKQTWIAIYIDEKPVKEYLFQPGNTVKWSAEEGFDILIGNAGGIEFFLNGDPVGNLGTEGSVVRLKLP
jgi:cytoskeletal protein RodZ